MKVYSSIGIIEEVILRSEEKSHQARISLCNFKSSPDYYERAIDCLHPLEMEYYRSLKYEKRIRDYTVGRYSAKLAISALCGQSRLDSILIRSGLFNQPVVHCDQGNNIQVSITHCDQIGMAVAFLEDYPLGIDVEKISETNIRMMEKQFTASEIHLIERMSPGLEYTMVAFWTAKESLSKVLKTGLLTPLEIFEIDKVSLDERHIVCTFKNFSQYQALSERIGDYVFSIVYPRHVEIFMDLNKLKNGMPTGCHYGSGMGIE
ncbi:4'-phosphopantetheinyl transferase superfamily protein [Paenibacillus sp. SYP-B3998]|uniref:4'-phosphopantetheinyl transferase superfamily protein n=1 Tax=Paenibacillus sp. SYP-B3998 TaxID=2678564 RepID=A0A6G4A5D7_9BACL|nr:4'-phosphopantetheinyl transferase superfamily protein [Paenibacillus sp. SYP-B3998]NEW09019.1 4'-phosphopantetheinyl transferase superfamily protein [Paenibacillus sp. SYP-B3998]